MKTGTLVFFCGKMGAGKSTLARKVSRERNAVLLSEDEWLAALYPDQIKSLKDYVNYAGLLKPMIKKLAQAILLTGTDVVMDFPGNTVSQRQAFREIFDGIQAEHQLHYLDVTDEVCLKQIAQRRLEHPERAATDTPEMFEQVTRHFVAPTSEEGFNIAETFRKRGD